MQLRPRQIKTVLPLTVALAVSVALATPETAYAADDNDFADIERIVVTASGFEQNPADAPASISVISAEELNKKSYTDITDAIKNIPGVYMTGGGNMADISIRGMSSSYTLYMIDGRPISMGRNVNTNGTDGGKQIGLPPISMIERIEVIRGPMSSLYGSDAMGGIINIITKKSAAEWHGSINAEWTRSFNDINNDKHKTDVYLSGGLIEGLLGMQLTGSWIKTAESDEPSADNKAGASVPDGTNTEAGVKFILTPNKENDVAFSYNKAKRDYTHNPGKSLNELNNNGQPNTPLHTEYEKDIYVLSHDGNYGNWRFSNYLQHDLSENIQADPSKVKKEQVTTLNSQASLFLEQHTVTLGGQYREEKVTDDTNGLLTADIDGAVRSVSRWIGAVFAEVDWGLTDDFSVVTGLRYNDDEFFGSHYSPRVYGIYHVSPNLTFKGGVSTGYKQPNLGEATSGFGQGTGGRNSDNRQGLGGEKDPAGERIPSALIIGNQDLKPETSTNIEFGYVYDNPETGLNTSLMVFYTEYNDKIAEDRYCISPHAESSTDYQNFSCTYNGTDFNFLSTKMNIDKASMQGVELTFDYELAHNWRLSGSHTFTQSEQRSGDFKGSPLNKMPKHMTNINAFWEVNHKLSSWAQYNFRGKTSDYLSRTSMAEGTPSYGFFDVGLNYEFTPTVRGKFGVYNLANKVVSREDYGVMLDGLRANVGITIDF